VYDDVVAELRLTPNRGARARAPDPTVLPTEAE
jgi:hypothetical protein